MSPKKLAQLKEEVNYLEEKERFEYYAKHPWAWRVNFTINILFAIFALASIVGAIWIAIEAVL